MSIRFTRTACAVALSLVFQSGFAATDDDAAVVVVTATRFSEADPRIPANISIISKKEIETSPAANLPDLLRSQAGINVRTLYGSMATDATVDLRGFGDTAASNTLILLDGQRLNPIDSGGIDWSSIPLEAVSRIEILRGSGSVLYGDRASGGVINIITDKSNKPLASAVATLGSYGYKAADAHLAGGTDLGHYNISGHYAQTDGWRQNSQSDQESVSGRVGYRFARGEGFLDFATFKESAGSPSSLFTNQFQRQPEMARKLFDKQSKEGYRVRPGFSLDIAPSLRLEAEVTSSSMDYHGRNFNAGGNPSYRNDRTSENLSATPRLRWEHGLAGLKSETVFGVDHYDGQVSNPSWSSTSGSNTQRASQLSDAVYFQNITSLTHTLDMTLGARNQRVSQQAEDVGATMNNSATRSRNAWELGLASRLTESLRLFGKTGRTFRFANTDELFGFDPNTYVTIFNGDLKPQQGNIREAGASWQSGGTLVRGSLYQMDLTDEIAYDDPSGTNVNLPATRRQGLELEGRMRIARNWDVRLAYTRTEASFREGVNAGNDIPMVPRNKASIDAVWHGGNAGNWSVLVNHVGNQRFSGDASNVREMLPSYTTVDVRASWNLQPWTLSARIANLFDRRYASSAGYSSWNADYYYYPAEPRSIFITAGYAFK